MIVIDSGPLVSAVGERNPRHDLAVRLVRAHAPEIAVAWPVVAEVDYLLRRTVGSRPANAFLRGLGAGEMRLISPTESEFALAVSVCEQYADLQLQLADAVVMAIADVRNLPILTWDFRDFRAVKRRDGESFALVVKEHEVPGLGGR